MGSRLIARGAALAFACAVAQADAPAAMGRAGCRACHNSDKQIGDAELRAAAELILQN